ncbi:MAG: peroxide stress protein YaaA [Lachnospiraceae bacterium]|nr:peroxide stress protein YaaA [Lachnospiraceae bacterium]
MKIILSPAKKMVINTDGIEPKGLPAFLNQTAQIAAWLKSKSDEDLRALWKCNEKIAKQNCERLEKMDLYQQLTPAILAYEGIAYQYMAPVVFEERQFEYVQEHLRILSAFYGVLKPMDGVTPYRLEMQAKAAIGNTKNLYDYWGDRLYHAVRDESGIIINLASKEYAKCIETYLSLEDTYITVTFCESVNGKLVTKGTYAKMARGEMVRYMAEKGIEDAEELKQFDRLGYVYRPNLSSNTEYIFERVNKISISDRGKLLCYKKADSL